MPMVVKGSGSGPLSGPARVEAAGRVLSNAATLWVVAGEVGVSFHLACALVEKESTGRNVYGHDKGGALAGFPLEVNADNFAVFRWLVIDQGQTSNGVGPMQLTYAGAVLSSGKRQGGHFVAMEGRGLKPWVVADNMRYGLELFKGYLSSRKGNVAEAGTIYNAGNLNAGINAYGRDLAAKDAAWKKVFGI
jgi:hypothetical protein